MGSAGSPRGSLGMRVENPMHNYRVAVGGDHLTL